jgi:hypothetical protein
MVWSVVVTLAPDNISYTVSQSCSLLSISRITEADFSQVFGPATIK